MNQLINNKLLMGLFGFLLVAIILFSIWYFVFRDDSDSESNEEIKEIIEKEKEIIEKEKEIIEKENEIKEGDGAGAGVAGSPAYTLIENSDFPGNDIRNEAGKTIDELKGICSQEQACLGFNNAGWLKKKLTTPITQTGIMFYKKNITTPLEADTGVAKAAETTEAGEASDGESLSKKATEIVTETVVEPIIPTPAEDGVNEIPASLTADMGPLSKFSVVRKSAISQSQPNTLYHLMYTGLDDCAQKCIDDPACLSFNGGRPTSNRSGYCTLNKTNQGVITHDSIKYDYYRKL